MKTIVRLGRGCCEEKMRASSSKSGDARSVVVRAVMNLAFARRQAAFAAAAEMIVVRADHDRFVLQLRIRAVENADDVCGGDFQCW